MNSCTMFVNFDNYICCTVLYGAFDWTMFWSTKSPKWSFNDGSMAIEKLIEIERILVDVNNSIHS